jgi:hypothetical protein
MGGKKKIQYWRNKKNNTLNISKIFGICFVKIFGYSTPYTTYYLEIAGYNTIYTLYCTS